MLRNLKDLFDTALNPGMNLPSASGEHSLQLATAVLLVEVIRADREIGEAERATAITALSDTFGLSDDEVTQLMELAFGASIEAHDLRSFTSEINRRCDISRRVRIIEYMWQVALADGKLCAHEHHLMRKVADLLYLSHGDYIAAKMRAQRSVGAGPGASNA
jgi:uncharacterized tellurite resistance protein B-like protein